MGINYLTFTLLVVLFTNSSAMASSCRDFITSKALRDQVQNLKQLAQEDIEVWNGYRLDDEVVIFTDARSAENCYAIVYDGDVVGHGFSKEALRIPNAIYNFLYVRDEKLPLPIKAEMTIRGKDSAILVSLHEWDFIPQDIRAFFGERGFVFNLIVHEGFHLFYQRESRGFPWPKWLKHPEHEDVVKYCYKNSKVAELYTSEHRFLVRSAELLYLKEDRPAAISAALKFISHRMQRYKVLTENEIGVPSFGSEDISCELAEASLEITEGVTNFIGAMTAMEINLWSHLQFIEYSKLLKFNPYFYGAGQLQFYLLKSLLSKELFSEVQKSLSESNDATTTVFTLFKRYLTRN